MTDLLQDIRYALRALARSPGFTAAAVLTLALGIGANTAIFTALDRIILRPLPVAHPEQLVKVVADRGSDGVNHNLPYPTFADLRDHTEVFSGLIAHTSAHLALTSPTSAERVEGGAVSAGFFTTLGLPLTLGRDIRADEDRPGAAADVVVLSQGFWRRRYNADRAVLGRSIGLNGRPFTIIGVAPVGLSGLVRGVDEQLWIPVSIAGQANAPDFAQRRGLSWLNVIGRLAPGFSREQANAALAGFDRALASQGFQDSTYRTELLPASRGFTGAVSAYREPLTILMAAVALVLLIACANVASLVLARASARRREIAIRVSLGAGPGRLFRRLITESAVLALAGGAAGLALAAWMGDAMPTLRTELGDPIAGASGMDGRVLAFAALATVMTVVVFGLAPAWQVARADVITGLKDADAGARVKRGRRRRFGARDTLVIAQVALSVLLLTGAALFLRTLLHLEGVSPGFDPNGVVLASFDLEPRGYNVEQRRQFYAQLNERLTALPGVDAASFASTITPNPGGSNWGGLRIEGYTPAPDEVLAFDVNSVGPTYFETLRIPVLRGRAFDPGGDRDLRCHQFRCGTTDPRSRHSHCAWCQPARSRQADPRTRPATGRDGRAARSGRRRAGHPVHA